MLYYVYILSNRSHTIYTGVTNDLESRIRQHKAKVNPASFASKYNITRLVYFEEFTNVNDAIEWEKRIKLWARAKKVALVQERNKYWRNLAADWNVEAPPRTHSNPDSPSFPHQSRDAREVLRCAQDDIAGDHAGHR